MDKRYQIFVSSTFADLQEERRKVIQVLMEMDCIPAGMELFPASDDEQFDFIKRIIDDCDYYILIIGGRYGSTDASGVSYTEKEFDYAKSIGLKVLSFVHGRPEQISVARSDIEPGLRAKLLAFREKVCADRLVKFWTETPELPGLVALSLQKTIRTYPAIGWIRANQAPSGEILRDINELRKENIELNSSLAEARARLAAPKIELAPLDETFLVTVHWEEYASRSSVKRAEKISASWAEIFASIAPDLQQHPADITVNHLLASALIKRVKPSFSRSISVDHDDFLTIRVQLIALGLIDARYLQNVQGGMGFYWSLTKAGFDFMIQLRTVKTSAPQQQ